MFKRENKPKQQWKKCNVVDMIKNSIEDIDLELQKKLLSNIVLSGNYLKIGRRIFKDCNSLEYASLESFQGFETSKESFIPRKPGSELDLTKLKGYKP